MKKVIVCTMAACLSFTFMPQTSSATVVTSSVSSTTADAATANRLMLRLQEIKAMDMSDISAQEKTVLRKEVRTIKQQLSDIGGGVYISAGALILIVILLIILL